MKRSNPEFLDRILFAILTDVLLDIYSSMESTSLLDLSLECAIGVSCISAAARLRNASIITPQTTSRTSCR